MQVITPNFKLGTTLPTYNSGGAEIFEIRQEKIGDFPKEFIKSIGMHLPFQRLSFSDKLRYEFEQRDRKITLKIRVPVTDELTSLHVLKIGEEFHRVYNIYNFINKDGIPETDLTLEKYVAKDVRKETKND